MMKVEGKTFATIIFGGERHVIHTSNEFSSNYFPPAKESPQ